MASYQTLSPCVSLSPNPILTSHFCCHSQGRSGYESPGMERTERMKACFRQDDAWSTGGDDFFVDDLLDLSNEDDFVEVEERDEDEGDSFAPANQEEQTDSGSDGSSMPGFADAVPVEELASLEWLSHFVEDSFSTVTGSLQYSPETGEQTAKGSCFVPQSRVPVKPRTKQNRTARVWPSLQYGFSDHSPSSSTTTGTTTTTTASLCLDSFRDVSIKKRRGRKPNRVGKAAEGVRRCSHCLVQKTPQWRAGPLGSKTLCNACGVRYKSGRLLPEYRPAVSPTFVSAVHSNSHRKVLEMRRKKETRASWITNMVAGCTSVVNG